MDSSEQSHALSKVRRAIFREDQKASVGVIIRDEQGRVIASMADNFSLPFLVDAVEVFAAKEAIKFA